MKLLKDARCLIQDTKIAAKREKAYDMLIGLIEDYNLKLLSTQVYWDNAEERDTFKKFWKEFKLIDRLKEIDYAEYVKEKEILYLKSEIAKVRKEKYDYSRLVKYYKRKLVDYGVMREIKGFASDGKYKKINISVA